MQAFDGLISLIVFMPVLGAAVIAVAGREQMLVRRIALGAVIIDLALATYAWLAYNANGPIVEQLGKYGTNPWIPGVNASYLLNIDGLSMPLVFLTALLGVVAVLGSWHVKERVREYHVWLLVLLTGVMGVFVAGDLLLFFLFWEVELVPMYFLIAMWGTGHREYSAMKFVLYTLFGSAFMLVGVLALRFAIGSFDMQRDDAGRAGGHTPSRLPESRCDLLHVPDRLCHQATRLAAPHVAAGRAHRRPDRRQRATRRRPAKDGRLRPDSHQRRHVPH